MPRGRPKVETDKVVKEENLDIYSSQIRVFDIRMTWTDAHDIYIYQNKLNEICKRWVFQIEKGKENGYIHLQGRISLIVKKKNKFQVLELFADEYKPNYVAPTICKEADGFNMKGNAFYQMKGETRIDGPYTNLSPCQYIPKQYAIKYDDLRPFQKEIYNNNEYNNRQINFIYCPQGCKGKTTISMICKLKQNGVKLPFCRDAQQLLYSAHNMISARNLRKEVKIFVDLPRAIDKKTMKEYILALEEIKSGWLYDLRNHMKEWFIDSPIIYVFSNKLPDFDDLSPDRWRLLTITDDFRMVQYDIGTGLMNADAGRIYLFEED